MIGTTHTISQPRQTKFVINGVSICIDNLCSVTMSNYKQVFVGPLKKGHHVINGFEGPKVHTMYKGTIAWKFYDDSVHPHQVEIPNDLYVPKGREKIISPQHLSHNATSANADATTLYGT